VQLRRFGLLLLLSLCFSSANAFAEGAPARAVGAERETDAGRPPLLLLTLTVDATEAQRKIFHSHLALAVTPGPLTLYYPQWIPGEHAPSGPVVDTAGLIFRAAGKTIPWKRDPIDLYAYHLEIPYGVASLEIAMDYLSPVETQSATFSEGTSATEQLAIVNWNQLVLYPKGVSADQIQVRAGLKLPDDWSFATALPVATRSGSTVQFANASLATLIDSPVLAGRYFKVVPLQHEKMPPHEIDIASDSAAALEMSASDRQAFGNLVAEASALFDSYHFRDYHFLLSLSNHTGHFGLEHHESSENRAGEGFLADPYMRVLGAALLPHEYIHSWNGKYRRPAGLMANNYQTPLKTDLLWVYEGLTEYYALVLTARSGLWTPGQFHDQLSATAMQMVYRPGRLWRSLEDTAVSAQLLFGASPAWNSWRRGADFYDEGVLLWLEADVIIRQQSNTRKSLDDFARLFFGGQSGPPEVNPYTIDDVIGALNQIAPYDWRKFFAERVTDVAPYAPLGGIGQAGWLLLYTETPSEMMRIRQEMERLVDATASIGLIAQADGLVVDTIHDMPGAKAGIGPGMKIVAVNGRKFSPRVLNDALQAGIDGNTPLELLIENAEFYKTIRLDYHGGPRYPHLTRDQNRRDLLGEIIKPRASSPPKRRE
jgi:predicted metalloprotease with PDZ domain